MIINERIKNLRKENRYTLKEIADKIGVSEGTMQRYESGYIKVIPYDHIVNLAELYDVEPAYIMGWQAEYKKSDLHPVDSTTAFERNIILAYRNATPDRKEAVLLLLGLKEG